MTQNKKNPYLQAAEMGLIAGSVVISVCLIGLVGAFDVRDVISEWLTLGQLMLYAAAPVVGYLVAVRNEGLINKLILSMMAGIVTALPTFLLILLAQWWTSIRDAFVNVSPDLIEIVTLSQENVIVGGLYLVGIFAILAVLGAGFSLIPSAIQRALLTGIGWTAGIGLMAEILINVLRSRLEKETLAFLFGKTGINIVPALILIVLISGFSYYWNRAGREQYQTYRENLPPSTRQGFTVAWTVFMVILVMILPSFLGVYLTEIANNVGLYILMGLGLNIAIGMAGLLDLGYVTNFAVGAYLMALLTTSSEYGLETPLSFWVALPICVVAAMITGFAFALPVLRMRGDYLAIATLGFGEIIRILAKSDALKGWIGGAQGILQIPKASMSGPVANGLSFILTPINSFLARFDLSILKFEEGSIVFDKPDQLFYLIIVACLIMLFISRRLNNSATGRRWMALREDEDVAAAMGINTTNAKVIAFTLSAASGGLAGAIFASKLGSIYPSSFQLLISVNVLALIIVGGLGSLPGVMVGAFALIGIPELLREFAEFRLLFYGIALIGMMLVRPEGLWPSEAQRRELSNADEEVSAVPTAGD